MSSLTLSNIEFLLTYFPAHINLPIFLFLFFLLYLVGAVPFCTFQSKILIECSEDCRCFIIVII